MLKIGTLFSGGLASAEFALKYENIEHEIVFACEFDNYARKQYEVFHGLPTSHFYKDVNTLNGTKYKDQIDLLVWGSPCQDLSLAGKRKGFDGEKSSLFRVGAKIQEDIKPKIFIFENVKGLLSSNGGRDYKEVIETFRKQGYNLVTLQMNTKDYGIPQNRQRVFIVGFLDVFAYHNFKEPQPYELKLRLKDLLEDEVDEKYYLSHKMLKGFLAHKQRHDGKKNGFGFEIKNKNSIANCLTTGEGNKPTSNWVEEKTFKLDSQANKVCDIDKQDVFHTLTSGTHGYSNGYVQIDLKQVGNIDQKGHNSLWGRVYSPDGLATTQNANGGGVGVKTGLYMVEKRIRRLTPLETFLLQGVKKEDIKLVNSDTQSYKISGNAISVNVMQELLKALYKQQEQKTSLFDFAS